MMLPLWWPRTACIYCGRRIRLDRCDHAARLHRVHDPRWLACDRHARLVPLDPLLAPPLALPGCAVTDAAEALRALVAVVDEVAWNGYAWIGLEPCVSCAVERPYHDPNCELQAALARAAAALDVERGSTDRRSAPRSESR